MDFFYNVISSDFDIIGITESWLNGSISSGELFSNKYNVFRRDRETSKSVKIDGGGASLAVKTSIPVTYHRELLSDAEDVWISVSDNTSRKVFICCVYLPGDDDYARTCFISNLERNWQMLHNHTVIIMGDFNMPRVNWLKILNQNYLEPNNVDNNSSSMIDLFSLCELLQFNFLKNNLESR